MLQNPDVYRETDFLSLRIADEDETGDAPRYTAIWIRGPDADRNAANEAVHATDKPIGDKPAYIAN